MDKTHSLKTRAKENSWFFIPFYIFLGITPLLILANSRGHFVLLLNRFHNDFLDSYFVFFSNIGDGISFAFLLAGLGLYRFKYLLLGLSTFLGSGAVTQILKHMFDLPRPFLFFQEQGIAIENFVEGVRVAKWLSFPSGHTTAGFAIFLFLAFITKYKKLGLLFFLCALSVGVARIYLVQHFLIDVYFGALLSTLVTTWIFNLYENSQKITNSNWYNYSVFEKVTGRKHLAKNH
jgi:membrane-associated phospholipid phosphatase